MVDFSLNNDEVLVKDEVGLILQQIDLLFDTHEDEVFGVAFGSNFYDLLWDMSITAADVAMYTLNLIKANINLYGWDVDVDAYFLEGTQSDIMLVKITLSNGMQSFEKTYKVD